MWPLRGRNQLRHLGDAEVADLDVYVALVADKENILQLKVAVHDAPAVDEVYCLEDLLHHDDALLLVVANLLLDPVVELPSLAELQHDTHRAEVVCLHVDELDDPRVPAHHAQHGDLVDGVLGGIGVLREDLQREAVVRVVALPAGIRLGELARAETPGAEVHLVPRCDGRLVVLVVVVIHLYWASILLDLSLFLYLAHLSLTNGVWCRSLFCYCRDTFRCRPASCVGGGRRRAC
mmetsp:Transcript_68871/g.156070  ORF Transcript_68871/g.156070 Transcript_68871/m.156070 type:complete len:235 (-) Transcript_68871:191-895(-)